MTKPSVIEHKIAVNDKEYNNMINIMKAINQYSLDVLQHDGFRVGSVGQRHRGVLQLVFLLLMNFDLH